MDGIARWRLYIRSAGKSNFPASFPDSYNGVSRRADRVSNLETAELRQGTVGYLGIRVPNSSGVPQTPLQIAEAGGRHAGFWRQRRGKTPDELLREAQTLRQRAAEHQDKITNQIGYRQVSDDPVIQARADAGRTRHLQKEIDNFTQQAAICEELAQRKLAGGP